MEGKNNRSTKSLALIGCGASTVLVLEAIKVRMKKLLVILKFTYLKKTLLM